LKMILMALTKTLLVMLPNHPKQDQINV